jgi:hypothetical protein
MTVPTGSFRSLSLEEGSTSIASAPTTPAATKIAASVGVERIPRASIFNRRSMVMVAGSGTFSPKTSGCHRQ